MYHCHASEGLPAEQRATSAAFRVRLACCPPLGAWEIGEHLANHLREGRDEDREAAAGLFHAAAVWHCEAGCMEDAKRQIKAAAEVWPAVRLRMADEARPGKW